MASRAAVLERVRARQQLEAVGPDKPLRFVLEFEAPRDPAEVAAEIREQLGIATSISRLSEAHGETAAPGEDGLVNFLAVTIPDVQAADIPDSPFELGYALADATGAVTAEPELGTDFYIAPHTFDGQLEGLDDFPPGCWVDPSQDPTPSQPLWAVKKIKAFDAWNLPARPGGKSKGEGIYVFQPDTGVADHAELGEGMIGTALAYDFVDSKPGAADPMNYSGNPGHGTGTSSVVASRQGGKMSGASPLATLVPLRAVTSVVVFDHGRVAAAVDYARRKGANVITMSLGGAWSSSLRAAIKQAIAGGVIVLAAAGNCVRFVVWPARYPEVIAVAGYNIHDQPWKGTCRGVSVDITAPGEFVPRANRAPDNGGSPTDVRGGQGTSFAVALTAGVAALWLGHHGPAAVKAALAVGETVQDRFAAVLKATAWRVSGWPVDTFGAGIVDAKRLLERALGATEGLPEGLVAETDPLRSVHTLLAEVVPNSLEAVTEATAGPPSSRRYAAELSHLALLKQKKRTTGGVLEQPQIDTPPSETLEQALIASGRGDLLEALR
jgi:serine protease